ITGILVVFIRVDVDVESFAVADAQELRVCGMEQLSGGPQPLSRQWPAGPVVNQANQIQIVRHRRELAAHSLLSEHESTISRTSHFFLRRAAVSCSLSRTR